MPHHRQIVRATGSEAVLGENVPDRQHSVEHPNASWFARLVILPLGMVLLALHPHRPSWPIEGGACCANTGLLGGWVKRDVASPWLSADL